MANERSFNKRPLTPKDKKLYSRSSKIDPVQTQAVTDTYDAVARAVSDSLPGALECVFSTAFETVFEQALQRQANDIGRLLDETCSKFLPPPFAVSDDTKHMDTLPEEVHLPAALPSAYSDLDLDVLFTSRTPEPVSSHHGTPRAFRHEFPFFYGSRARPVCPSCGAVYRVNRQYVRFSLVDEGQTLVTEFADLDHGYGDTALPAKKCSLAELRQEFGAHIPHLLRQGNESLLKEFLEDRDRFLSAAAKAASAAPGLLWEDTHAGRPRDPSDQDEPQLATQLVNHLLVGASYTETWRRFRSYYLVRWSHPAPRLDEQCQPTHDNARGLPKTFWEWSAPILQILWACGATLGDIARLLDLRLTDPVQQTQLPATISRIVKKQRPDRKVDLARLTAAHRRSHHLRRALPVLEDVGTGLALRFLGELEPELQQVVKQIAEAWNLVPDERPPYYPMGSGDTAESDAAIERDWDAFVPEADLGVEGAEAAGLEEPARSTFLEAIDAMRADVHATQAALLQELASTREEVQSMHVLLRRLVEQVETHLALPS